jgi:hypothetical protein
MTHCVREFENSKPPLRTLCSTSQAVASSLQDLQVTWKACGLELALAAAQMLWFGVPSGVTSPSQFTFSRITHCQSGIAYRSIARCDSYQNQ